jgi:hypothetical protein
MLCCVTSADWRSQDGGPLTRHHGFDAIDDELNRHGGKNDAK